MKHLFTIAVLLFSMQLTHAQPIAINAEYQAFLKHKPTNTPTIKKTRGIGYRLVKDSSFTIFNTSGLMAWESANDYTYSGNRGTELVKSPEYGYYYHDNDADEANQVYADTIWSVARKTLAKFNTDEHLTELVFLAYNNATSNFDTTNKYVYIYNAANIVELHQLNYDKPNTQWDSMTKFEYAYNTNNQLIQELEKQYNSITLTFVDKSKYSYQYAGTLMSNMKFEKYHIPTASWVLTYESQTTYTPFNKIIEQTNFAIHSFNNVFDTVENYHYLYHANQTLDSSYSYQYYYDALGFHQDDYTHGKLLYNVADTNFVAYIDYSPSSWGGNIYKRLYQFDANKNLIHYFTDELDTLTQVYSPISRTDYYYTTYTNSTGIDKQAEKITTALYPNPCINHSYVSFSIKQDDDITITVTDLTGKAVKTLIENGYKGDHLVKIPTQQLPQGLYIITLRVNNQIISATKLMKQ